jgi:hypothetical protein
LGSLPGSTAKLAENDGRSEFGRMAGVSR